MKANYTCFRLSILTLLSTEKAKANDNSLVNLLNSGNWYNLEQADPANSIDDILFHQTEGNGDFIYNDGLEGEDYHVAQSNGSKDIIVEDGHGETQIAHDGDITSSNRKNHRRHFHVDTDDLRQHRHSHMRHYDTKQAKKKKSKKSKGRKNYDR